jgi:magnesium chelatase subunit D
MSECEPAADARLAIRLFACCPERFGVLVLRGAGPLRDNLFEELRGLLPAKAPMLRLPANADDAALLGGIDLSASLAAGRPVRAEGLLVRAAGGALVVPMAERIDDALAGRLAQALDRRDCALVLLDDGVEDERPPESLLDRAAFIVDCGVPAAAGTSFQKAPSREGSPDLPLHDAYLVLAGVAEALGITEMRPLLQASLSARTHAALHARDETDETDVAAAARLVLAPRATRLPSSPQQSSHPELEPENTPDSQASGRAVRSDAETVLEAALAAIPGDLLARLTEGAASRRAKAGGGGKRARSALRGRPLGARPGMPRGGARLALIDTLRAAVPWQAIRRAVAGADTVHLLQLRKSDLRVRRFAERARAVTILAVDASGSAAIARLAEAKGAVERLLAQAYVTRTEVALIAFRGDGADLLLPPTRSLTRARRSLAQLPGGGGTPLASGIAMARDLAGQAAARGATPLLVFLTDGSANIAADGTPGRARAIEDAKAAARALAASGHPALVIDIAPRPRPEAQALATAMQARYLPLPVADSSAIEHAVGTAVRAA